MSSERVVDAGNRVGLRASSRAPKSRLLDTAAPCVHQTSTSLLEAAQTARIALTSPFNEQR